MNKKQTEVLIALATIAINNKEGFTVNAKTLQPVTRGYAVAVPCGGSTPPAGTLGNY